MLLCERTFPGEKVVHPDGTLSLEESHDVGNRVFGWDSKHHVHMIRASIAFKDFYLFLFCQFPDDLSDLYSDRSKKDFLAVFW